MTNFISAGGSGLLFSAVALLRLVRKYLILLLARGTARHTSGIPLAVARARGASCGIVDGGALLSSRGALAAVASRTSGAFSVPPLLPTVFFPHQRRSR